jgi:hypothetical protein
MKRTLGVLAAVAVLGAAAPSTFGGWAVITVEELPNHLVVGEPYHLAFTVRQHGRDPMNRLDPTVALTYAGGEQPEPIQAERGARDGLYVAEITPELTGPVRVAIDANWMETRIELLPIVAVRPGTTIATHEPGMLGRQLFVSKGCVTCHAKVDDPEVHDRHYYAAGPALTGRTWPAEWLATKLRNPASARVASPSGMDMPNLDLRGPEIAALVRYLNGASAEVSVAR